MQHDHPNASVPVWRRCLAYCWYGWGLSLCHWGLRTADESFFRAAVDSFDRATAIWPGFATCLYRRGVIRSRELGQHRQGIADLGRASRIAPEWSAPYLQRGLLQRFHGDQHAALDDLRRYLELDPASPWRDEAERQIAQLLDESGQVQQGAAA